MSNISVTLSRLHRDFPSFSSPVPLHWLETGLPEPWETRIIAGVLITLILFSYSVNALWVVIYRQ